MARHKDTGRPMVTCRRCGGGGFIKVARAHTDGKGKVTTVQNEEPCPDCGGAGVVQG